MELIANEPAAWLSIAALVVLHVVGIQQIIRFVKQKPEARD